MAKPVLIEFGDGSFVLGGEKDMLADKELRLIFDSPEAVVFYNELVWLRSKKNVIAYTLIDFISGLGLKTFDFYRDLRELRLNLFSRQPPA